MANGNLSNDKVFDYAYKRFILDSKLHKTNLSTISLRDKAQLMQGKQGLM